MGPVTKAGIDDGHEWKTFQSHGTISQMTMDYFLTSRRLGFRCWTSGDLPFALRIWTDPEVTRFIGEPCTPEAARLRLQKEIAHGEECGLQYWPIFLLEGDQHAGCAGLHTYHAERRIYELGVHLRPEFWGKGLAREASGTVIAYAFGTLGAEALFAGHHPANKASRRLLRRLGFVHTHEEFYPPTGLMHPSYLLRRPQAWGS